LEFRIRQKIYERTSPVGECLAGDDVTYEMLPQSVRPKNLSHEFRITREIVVSQKFLKVAVELLNYF